MRVACLQLTKVHSINFNQKHKPVPGKMCFYSPISSVSLSTFINLPLDFGQEVYSGLGLGLSNCWKQHENNKCVIKPKSIAERG